MGCACRTGCRHLMCVQNRVRAWAEQGRARVGWGDNGGKWGDNGTGAMGEKKVA